MRIFRVQVRCCACMVQRWAHNVCLEVLKRLPRQHNGNCMYIRLVCFLVMFCYDSIYSYNTNASLTILNKTWLSLCDSAFWRFKCRMKYVQEQNLLERSRPLTCRSIPVYLWLISNRPILKSRSASFISVIFYGLNLARLSLRISFKMSGSYKCLAPFSFIYRPIFIALVRPIIVTLCLVHQRYFLWLESRPCLAQNFRTGSFLFLCVYRFASILQMSE